MKFIKKHFSTLIIIVILLAGLSLLLYPTISDYWNSFHQTRAIASYVKAVDNLDKKDYERIWNEARQYNKNLGITGIQTPLSKAKEKEYNKLLDISGNGIMAYIEIPKIKVSLPIYHGVDEGILQIATGHIAGTSLPVGGKSSHCVISGHRGLPSARLFTDLDKMTKGDVFTVHVLDKTLTYEVDQIRVVLPDNISDLKIEDGQDLFTLVTCTPYGVNTHRLLVRGHRIANIDSASEAADAVRVDTLVVASVIAIPVLVMLIIGLFIRTGNKKKHKKG
ncbi:MAG: class C sortase [Anaerostipes hadrus]